MGLNESCGLEHWVMH